MVMIWRDLLVWLLVLLEWVVIYYGDDRFSGSGSDNWIGCFGWFFGGGCFGFWGFGFGFFVGFEVVGWWFGFVGFFVEN